MAFGVPIVFYEGPFKPETCYSLMEKYRVTNFAYAPTAYRAMAAAGADVIRRYQLNVRAMSSAGEPLNPEVIRFFQEHLGVTIHDHYGLSVRGEQNRDFLPFGKIYKKTKRRVSQKARDTLS